MYQRSCDLGLGVPFNIASYALLTHMIAYVTDTEPLEFILQMGDAHVYKDHVEPLKVQLEREPRDFPTLQFKRGREEVGGIDGFRTEDFEVVGYKPLGKIEMKMSVSHTVWTMVVIVYLPIRPRVSSRSCDGFRLEICLYARYAWPSDIWCTTILLQPLPLLHLMFAAVYHG